MSYRLATHIRISPSPEGQGTGVLVDSRDLSAHYLDPAAYLVVRAALTRGGAAADEIAASLHIAVDEASTLAERLLTEMVERGWVSVVL